MDNSNKGIDPPIRYDCGDDIELKFLLDEMHPDCHYPVRYDDALRIWCGWKKGLWITDYSKIRSLLKKYGNVTVREAYKKKKRKNITELVMAR